MVISLTSAWHRSTCRDAPWRVLRPATACLYKGVLPGMVRVFCPLRRVYTEGDGPRGSPVTGLFFPLRNACAQARLTVMRWRPI